MDGRERTSSTGMTSTARLKSRAGPMEYRYVSHPIRFTCRNWEMGSGRPWSTAPSSNTITPPHTPLQFQEDQRSSDTSQTTVDRVAFVQIFIGSLFCTLSKVIKTKTNNPQYKTLCQITKQNHKTPIWVSVSSLKVRMQSIKLWYGVNLIAHTARVPKIYYRIRPPMCKSTNWIECPMGMTYRMNCIKWRDNGRYRTSSSRINM